MHISAPSLFDQRIDGTVNQSDWLRGRGGGFSSPQLCRLDCLFILVVEKRNLLYASLVDVHLFQIDGAFNRIACLRGRGGGFSSP
ncbi:hypothetical protein CEXT_491461 [Caerostris extrusa]|uniref:Uncharacterized protein n=1 Tax=Caerostris extrusa TaxID=172846 RepID=A0AAV4Y7E5_CAEEX|nr:hypothetical protein CEXT_491461 [Caerostris extrusa]